MPRRWDGDDRGRGVADAEQLVDGAEELLVALRETDWVAERPELHLGPHVEQWCQRDGRPALLQASTDDRGAYVLELEWRGEPTGAGRTRAAVFSLVGSFAESVTYVRQRVVPGAGSKARLRFEAGTGELGSGSGFDPHGHVVLIDVAGVV